MKILFSIVFIVTAIVANDTRLESNIFNTIVHGVIKKENPKVFLHTKIESLQKYPGDIEIVFNCKEADMVILSTLKDIPDKCNAKVMFGTKYSQLKDKRVVGAFFWQKGRPNILFYKNRLQKHHIKLAHSFDKYVE